MNNNNYYYKQNYVLLKKKNSKKVRINIKIKLIAFIVFNDLC